MDLIGMRRLAALWLIPFGFLFVIVVPPLALIGRLPDPLAIHWGFSGSPDGSLPFWWSLAFLAGFWVIVWIGLLVVGRSGLPSSPALTVAYFVGGLLAAVQIAIVDRNLNAGGWQAADDLEWWGAVIVVIVALAAGAGGWLLGTRTLGDDGATGDPGAVPSAGLRPGEAPEWRGSQSLWLPVLIALAAFGALPFLPAGMLWLPFLLAVPALLFASVGTRVTEDGLTVTFGLWGWPRMKVAAAMIERVEVVQVEPMAYGGWGLRLRGGTTAVVVRRGPGIRVVRPGKRALVVTCTDPVRAAGLLNDYAARFSR